MKDRTKMEPEPEYTKLGKRFKTKWLKALRSGNFKVARKTLIRIDDGDIIGYCCIAVGVAALRNAKPGVELKELTPDDTNEASTEIGLDEKTNGKLIELNDDKLWSFNKIANWIEKHL